MKGLRPLAHVAHRARGAGIAGLVVMATLVASPARAADVDFSSPGLLTSVGQSVDVAIVKVLLNTQLKLGLEYKPTAQPADLAGMKTLVVVLGFSTKGLGAAGLDMAKEIARARALMKAARSQGVKVLAMHTGGAARRGRTSDDLIELVVPDADCTIVVASGNQDKLFNQLAAGRHAPVIEVEKTAAVGDAVKAIFK
ncbi:MAG TPA: DUF6305 family protein [Vicinamibacterales bacterium]